MTINHIIIEGIDRLGKDVLINGLQNRLGFFQVLHYQKPILLEKYKNEAISSGLTNPDDIKRFALQCYQRHSFNNMFKTMRSTNRIICNRSHLGEYVYSKRYRGYSGDYVFDIETLFNYPDGPLDNILLIVLYTSDFSFISDDGLSLDVSKREEEQEDFIIAFNKSIIKNKILIDVNDNGKFASSVKILDIVCNTL